MKKSLKKRGLSQETLLKNHGNLLTPNQMHQQQKLKVVTWRKNKADRADSDE